MVKKKQKPDPASRTNGRNSDGEALLKAAETLLDTIEEILQITSARAVPRLPARGGQFRPQRLPPSAPSGLFLDPLQRGMAVTMRLGRLQSEVASLQALVDALSTPIFLVDRSGALRYSNSAGDDALRRGQYLVLRNGGLSPRCAEEERHLKGALDSALSGSAGEPALSLLLHDGQGSSALLRVHSLQGQATPSACASRAPSADAALFLTRVADDRRAAASRLRAAFALTPAETRLVEHLIKGENLAAIGAHLTLSRETLKTQLRSLFSKTGTHRQAELIARLLSSVSFRSNEESWFDRTISPVWGKSILGAPSDLYLMVTQRNGYSAPADPQTVRSSFDPSVDSCTREADDGSEPCAERAFELFSTTNASLERVVRTAQTLSPSREVVLITGETGVGKELLARAIHEASGRSGSFVACNVAGLEDSVFDDTLFGHLRGAFTGADQPRRGLAAAAQEGTLFLDEVGELRPQSQVKLLRFLESGEYFPLGSDAPRRSSARLIAATNSDLRVQVSRGLFRQDLYFRLAAFHLTIPPLRERIDDLPLLCDSLLRALTPEGEKAPRVSPGALRLLRSLPYPGNVRELRHILLRAKMAAVGGLIDSTVLQGLGFQDPVAGPGNASVLFPGKLPTVREVVDALVQEALRRAGGRQNVAGAMIGISPQAISKRLRNLKVRKIA